jgi:hypothetical protein
MIPAARALVKTALAAADIPFRTRPGPRILIYHQVGSGLGRQMEVTTNAFEFQLTWLLDNGSIVSLDEALERAGEPDSHKLYVLTFDDGYRDVYTTAFPLLRAARVPFLVYATTEPIETGRAMTPEARLSPSPGTSSGRWPKPGRQSALTPTPTPTSGRLRPR